MVLIITGALIAGKAALEAVLSGHGALKGVADILSGDRSAVVKDMTRLDGEGPVGRCVVGQSCVQDVWDDFKIVVQLHHILVYQVAQELVGVVGGEDGV